MEFALIISGILSGILGGMGMGGGTILIPVLGIFFGIDQHVAQAVNLISFVPMAAISIAIHLKNGLMEKKGVSTYRLRETCGIDSKTVRRLKANENVETKTLDRLCEALNCCLEDIAEYVPNR